MPLVNTLIKDFVRLLAGKIEHFGAEPTGIFRLIDKAFATKIDHDTAGYRDFRRDRALSRTDVCGVWLERAHVLRSCSGRQTHFDAVAGAATVTRKRDVDCLRNILRQQLRARAEPAGGENYFSRRD